MGDGPNTVLLVSVKAVAVSVGQAMDRGNGNDPVEILKKLKDLFDAGVLTQDEFDTKKAEALKRL